MFVYHDKCFCRAESCKFYKGCERAMTEEVMKAAKDFGLPISFTERMEYYKEKNYDNDN